MNFTMSEGVLLRQWVAAFWNPMVDPTTRLQLDKALQALVYAKPREVIALFTGAIARTMRSLPTDDPWRRMRLENGVSIMEDGAPFNADAATDLARPQDADPYADPYLIAFAPGISELAAGILTEGSRSWSDAYDYMTGSFFLGDLDQDDVAAIHAALTSALRWATMRRYLYDGMDQEFPVAFFLRVMFSVGDAISGDKVAMAKTDTPQASESIAPGSWKAITGATGGF